MNTNILFLCPHGAAKSLFARYYCTHLAQQANLSIQADNAGTEPDPAFNPKVVAYLANEGINVAEGSPKLLTAAMLETADVIVSIGCISAEQAPSNAHFLDWSDVPMLSTDFQTSRDKIYSHVQTLIIKLQTEPL